MADIRTGARSVLATVIGWIIVALIVYWLFHFLLGTILWVLRAVLAIVIVGGLFWVYLRLKSPSSKT